MTLLTLKSFINNFSLEILKNKTIKDKPLKLKKVMDIITPDRYLYNGLD
jgi:hypothetical protein